MNTTSNPLESVITKVREGEPTIAAVAPVRSIDSSSRSSENENLGGAKAQMTTGPCDLPPILKRDVALDSSGVDAICQLFNIPHASAKDILFLLIARGHGMKWATEFARHAGWDCSPVLARLYSFDPTRSSSQGWAVLATHGMQGTSAARTITSVNDG